MVTVATREDSQVSPQLQRATNYSTTGGAMRNEIFQVGDSIKIKRSSGQDQQVNIKEINYESRMVFVSWKGPDDELYEKEIPFNSVSMLNRTKKFSVSKKTTDTINNKQNQHKEALESNKHLKIQSEKNDEGDVHLSPQRPKSSMADSKKHLNREQEPDYSFSRPIKMTHNNSNLQRSVSSMSSEIIMDDKQKLDKVRITEKPINDTKKVIATKKRASVLAPKSKVPMKRMSLAPSRRSLAPRMSLAPQSQISQNSRPQTKVHHGPRAIHKAASQVIYAELISEEKENILIHSIKHRHKKKYDRITVAVRKRPMNENEIKQDGIDIVSILDEERISVHEPKEKVDMTRYIDNSNFRFDYVFGPEFSNDSIYKYCVWPMIQCVFDGGNATCFVYGQTGSGKTYTIYGSTDQTVPGLCTYLLQDMLAIISKHYQNNRLLYISLFEIYGSKILDLLNSKKSLKILEDQNGKGIVKDLHEIQVEKVNDIFDILLEAIKLRCSGKTSCNDNSSRSHAVLQITLKDMSRKPKVIGKYSLIDLAGNERGQDNINMDLQTRQESSEINRNLLSLKECIRALDKGSDHIPFRECILTKVLKDCFVAKNCKTCMIAHISPALICSEHTLNTLRYTSRVKELPFRGSSEKMDEISVVESSFASNTKTEKTNNHSKIVNENDVIAVSNRNDKELILSLKEDIKSEFNELMGSQHDILQYLVDRMDNDNQTTIDSKKRLLKIYKQYCTELISSKQAILSRLSGIN